MPGTHMGHTVVTIDLFSQDHLVTKVPACTISCLVLLTFHAIQFQDRDTDFAVGTVVATIPLDKEQPNSSPNVLLVLSEGSLDLNLSS